MTSRTNDTGAESVAGHSATAEPQQKGKSSNLRELPAPRLATYFGEKAVPVHHFLKAVKTAKLRRFEVEDEAAAQPLMEQYDPSSSRLCSLAAQPQLPEAVERWVWGAIQKRLKVALPEDAELLSSDALTTLRVIHKYLIAPSEQDKLKKSARETMARLALIWLVKRRSLDVWEALVELRRHLYSDEHGASRRARNILAQAKPQDLKCATAICGLAEEKVSSALLERDDARRQTNTLRDSLSRLEDSNRTLQGELERERSNANSLTEELASLRQLLNNKEQHWGHDVVEIRAKHASRLRELVSLLNDARDALEMEPPAPQIAIKRIRATIAAIEDALR